MKSMELLAAANGAASSLPESCEFSQLRADDGAIDLSSMSGTLKQEAVGRSRGHEPDSLSQSSALIPFEPQQCANESVSAGSTAYHDEPYEISTHYALKQKLAEVTAALQQSMIREQQLLHHAFHDHLTGLPNVALFQDRLVTALVQAERHRWRFAVMFIDLDRFKSINDRHGHDVGDCLLKIVAQRLQKLVRRGDTVSRRSGDEFLFLMPEAKNTETVTNLARKITGKIADPCRIGELDVSISASVGISVYPEDGRFPNELLKNADAAMYAAKQKHTAFTFYRELVRK